MKMGHALKKTDFPQMCAANDFECHWPEAAYVSVDANGNVTSITPPGRPAHNRIRKELSEFLDRSTDDPGIIHLYESNLHASKRHPAGTT